MTNIHSSPNAAPSSLGCQVIPVGEDFAGLIAEVIEKNKAEARGRRGSVLYTLIDASKVTPTLVKAEAVETERSYALVEWDGQRLVTLGEAFVGE